MREIPYEESVRALVEIRGGEDGFEPLFNGEDLSGWIGAVNDYEVADGALRCKAGQGGNLVTEEEFDNFVLRFEFKLPPGGNNGLAIRAPTRKATSPTRRWSCKFSTTRPPNMPS